jgi:hypothetical protein
MLLQLRPCEWVPRGQERLPTFVWLLSQPWQTRAACSLYCCPSYGLPCSSFHIFTHHVDGHVGAPIPPTPRRGPLPGRPFLCGGGHNPLLQLRHVQKAEQGCLTNQ